MEGWCGKQSLGGTYEIPLILGAKGFVGSLAHGLASSESLMLLTFWQAARLRSRSHTRQ